MKRQGVKTTRDRFTVMERQWLRADEAAHQARLIVEAAQGKYEQGREGDASILVGAAKVILDRYAEDGSDEH